MTTHLQRVLSAVIFVFMSCGLTLPQCVAAETIVFLGNSITQHGPDPSIEWEGNWGMAASRPAFDYVTQATALLQASLKGRLKPVAVSDYFLERDFFELSPDRIASTLSKVRSAQYVILQLGDNVDRSGARSDSDLFGRQYALILSNLRARFGSKARLVCVGKWWPAPDVDSEIERRCKIAGGVFVPVADLHAEPWGHAAAERHYAVSGVGDHPGDRSMREIAGRVANALSGKPPTP